MHFTKIIFLFFLFLPAISFSQKAYESVLYEGKSNNYEISFDFKDGFPEGSIVKMTDQKQKITFVGIFSTKRSVISKGLKFELEAAFGLPFPDGINILETFESLEKMPAKIKGNYELNQKKITFTLYRK